MERRRRQLRMLVGRRRSAVSRRRGHAGARALASLYHASETGLWALLPDNANWIPAEHPGIHALHVLFNELDSAEIARCNEIIGWKPITASQSPPQSTLQKQIPFKGEFVLSANKEIVPNLANAIMYLRTWPRGEMDIRFDEMAQMPVWKGPGCIWIDTRL